MFDYGVLVRMAELLGDGRRLVLHTLWPAGVPAIAIEEDGT